MNISRSVSAALIVVAASACGTGISSKQSAADSVVLMDRARRLSERLADSTSGAGRATPVGRWVLPPALNEVSGIAMTSEGRLLAHGDEYGRISVLDPRRGILLKEFSIGAKADFEGIAATSGMIYMIDSNGQIYSFREGAPGQRVTYTLIDTRLGRECEFEGIAYDPRRGALLLPCKNIEKKELRGNVVIYVWQLNAPTTSQRLSMITVPMKFAIGNNPWAAFRPTDITVDPRTGNYVLVAAQERALLELEPNGKVVRSMPLPGGDEEHPQAEGVAITEDGMLVVSNEATGRPASITLYRWPLEPAAETAP
ncbi:MAG: SdiA-regulated domain-containing protein [Gemmatimonadaceae bacterium]